MPIVDVKSHLSLPRIDALQRAIMNSTYSEEQRVNMIDFLRQKQEFVKHGELRDSHFERLAELGYGNGGVVLKVRHQLSGTIMARKVGACCHGICPFAFHALCFPSDSSLLTCFQFKRNIANFVYSCAYTFSASKALLCNLLECCLATRICWTEHGILKWDRGNVSDVAFHMFIMLLCVQFKMFRMSWYD